MIKKLLLIHFILWLTVGFTQQSDTTTIRAHFNEILAHDLSRSHDHPLTLDSVASYIFEQFSLYGDTSYYQNYFVNETAYRNVICVFGKDNEKTIVVGAHYDVCGNQAGADDNASGTVGLLELARLLKGRELKYRIELVAYTLEEPPYFRSNAMGSYIHAESLSYDSTKVYGMVCLEMIGYFRDEHKTQEYPLKFLRIFYGNKGNYITLVNKFNKGAFSRRFSGSFSHESKVRTKKFTGPRSLAGIDFSDHLNYWDFGYSAVMVTDTAFYRNKNYHHGTDTLDTLDLGKMALVIDAVFDALLGIQ